MTEWEKYTGSDEQIAEMRETINGFILRDSIGVQTGMFKRIGSSYIGEYIDSRRKAIDAAQRLSDHENSLVLCVSINSKVRTMFCMPQMLIKQN